MASIQRLASEAESSLTHNCHTLVAPSSALYLDGGHMDQKDFLKRSPHGAKVGRRQQRSCVFTQTSLPSYVGDETVRAWEAQHHYYSCRKRDLRHSWGWYFKILNCNFANPLKTSQCVSATLAFVGARIKCLSLLFLLLSGSFITIRLNPSNSSSSVLCDNFL